MTIFGLALRRCGIVLILGALASGCSSSGPSVSEHVSERSNECRWNRNSCLYEGSYEPGERDYAEQEAKRLNRAASQRLRRTAGW